MVTCTASQDPRTELPELPDLIYSNILQSYHATSNIDSYAPKTQLWVPEYLQVPMGIDVHPQDTEPSVQDTVQTAVKKYQHNVNSVFMEPKEQPPQQPSTLRA